MDENIGREACDLEKVDDPIRHADWERLVSPDDLLSAVANKYRRAILNSLNSESDNVLEYDALVDRVADRIRDEESGPVTDELRQRVRIALHHIHLPKLAAVRMIDYETETGYIQFIGGELEQEILTLVGSHDTYE